MIQGTKLNINEYYPLIHSRLNKKIIQTLYKNKKQFYQTHKINGRWENQFLNVRYIPQVKQIFRFACLAAKSFKDIPLIIPYKELGLPINEFWFNISKPGDATAWHNHKNQSILSGVYYLKVPKNSGNIKFRKRISEDYIEWVVKAEAGKMILFDPTIKHSVPKNRSDENRISLAFNLYSIPLALDYSRSDYKSKKFYS